MNIKVSNHILSDGSYASDVTLAAGDNNAITFHCVTWKDATRLADRLAHAIVESTNERAVIYVTPEANQND